jgi:hypothetical protein
MRIEEVWDKWMKYDEDGFVCGIREDAPDEVKAAYKRHLAEMEEARENGLISK